MRPPPTMVKVNIDTAIFIDKGVASLGAVIRDESRIMEVAKARII